MQNRTTRELSVKQTVSSSDGAVFALIGLRVTLTSADDSQMAATLGRYSLYNTGIRNNSGTVSMWMKTDTSIDTRYIFAGTNKKDGLITAYLTADNKLAY